MAAENLRLEAIMAEYPKVVKALLSAKSEMGLLRRRIKKLWKMNAEAINVLRRQALVMKARDAEISSKDEELQRKEGEIRELEKAMAQLRGARELLNQLEQCQKERAGDAAELIRLRWVNGCLRHELAKNQQSPEHEETGDEIETEIAVVNDETKHCNIGNNLDGSFMGAVHKEADHRVADTKQAGSSKRVLHRLKKWVRGKEKKRDLFEEQARSSAPENIVEEIAAASSLRNM